MKTRFPGMLVMVVSVALVMAVTIEASAGDFYAGKTIKIVVGNPVGGGFDLYARLVSRHLGIHIPGNPNIILANMPGGGGVAAANHLFQAAKADGLTIGVWNPSFILRQALGDATMAFESTKFRWIGSVTGTTEACAIMGFRGLKNWQQIQASKDPILMAATRPGANSHYLPTLLSSATGAKFQVVSGYAGTAPILLALQRREVHGACWNWESMRVIAKDMLKADGADKLIPFLIERKPQEAALKDAQLFREIFVGEYLKMYEALTAYTEFFYPLMFPPGVSDETLNLLRRAFTAVVRDPKLVIEARTTGLSIEYVRGEEIEAQVPKIVDLPASLGKNLRLLLEVN